MSPPKRYTKLFQINEDDLETCEVALEALRDWVPVSKPEVREHFDMMQAAIKRVRDNYGPHTNVKVIES